MDGGREFLFLGTGTSVGVPVIGCDCRVCRSPDPRDARTRSSVLLRLPGGTLLIDTGPELRLQLVRERVGLVHAVLYTHYHADHLFGLDDARLFPFKLGGPLPLYCTDDVEAVVRRTFPYAFQGDDLPSGMVVPRLLFRRITHDPFDCLGQRVVPVPLDHGRFQVLGFRFGDVAYCTDVSGVPDESWPLLEGLRVLVLGALRPGKPHPAHFSLEQALDVVRRVTPETTYLTHMGHEMEYAALAGSLPAGVLPAHDGLRFRF